MLDNNEDGGRLILFYFIKIFFVIYLLILAGTTGMWDLSSPARGQTCACCFGRAES